MVSFLSPGIPCCRTGRLVSKRPKNDDLEERKRHGRFRSSENSEAGISTHPPEPVRTLDNISPLLFDGRMRGSFAARQAVLQEATDAVERRAGGGRRDEADQSRADIP